MVAILIKLLLKMVRVIITSVKKSIVLGSIGPVGLLRLLLMVTMMMKPNVFIFLRIIIMRIIKLMIKVSTPTQLTPLLKPTLPSKIRHLPPHNLINMPQISLYNPNIVLPLGSTLTKSLMKKGFHYYVYFSGTNKTYKQFFFIRLLKMLIKYYQQRNCIPQLN